MLHQTLLFFSADSCDDPTPANGNTNPSSELNGHYNVGAQVNFTCDAGFRPVGNVFSICQENLTWSHQPLTCYPSNIVSFVLKYGFLELK